MFSSSFRYYTQYDNMNYKIITELFLSFAIWKFKLSSSDHVRAAVFEITNR